MNVRAWNNGDWHPGVALHGFIKKTRTTPDEDMALARKREKELER
jgi:phage-related protein